MLKRGAATLGIQLSGVQVGQFRRYYDEIIDWNRRVNLTSVTDWDQVQRRLILESLSVISALPGQVLDTGRVLDVGSGAGFPGLALKIAFPRLRVTLLDATAKKTAFLAHVTGVLELRGIDVVTGRAETLAHDPAHRESYDVVLARAVARLPALAELTLPFCRTGGLVVAQKGAGIDGEVDEATRAIEVMGGELKEVHEIAIECSQDRTTLVVLAKLKSTPPGYPRRPGIPARRPL